MRHPTGDCGRTSDLRPALRRFKLGPARSDGSRGHPRDLSVFRRSDSSPPPETLRLALAGHPILSALGDETGPLHRRLLDCGASAVFSFDPRSRDGPGHVTVQWQRDLERQGLLLAKCIYTGRDVTSIRPGFSILQRGSDLLR